MKLNIRLLSVCFLSVGASLSAKAQTLVQSAQKIKSYKNISYTDIVRTKFHFQDDFFADTVQTLVTPIAAEKSIGGYYLVSSKNNSFAYDGNKVVNLSLSDSTYKVERESAGGQNTRTLLYWAQNMDKVSLLPMSKRTQLKDTLIDKIAYTNIRVTESDTVVNNVRQYNATNFILDKKSFLPVYIIRRMVGNADDGSLFKFTERHSFSGLVFNQQKFPDLSVAFIPAHFRIPTKNDPAVFLSNGTPGPAIKAVDLAGNAFDLTKLKGKMVLLNFSLIGCPHCVGAAQMLNRLHEKYGDKGLAIVNIYPVDQKEAILKFDKSEHVQTPSYTSDKTVQKLYPYDGYPSFYLLDKSGLVLQSYNGFYKSLEAELSQKLAVIND